MIIDCPYCRARYEVAAELIGGGTGTGRRVRCAECRRDWRAPSPSTPDSDELFTDEDENRLDYEFSALDGRFAPVAASAAVVEPAAARLPRQDFTGRDQPAALSVQPPSRSRQAYGRRSPLAGLRGGARVVGLLVIIAVVAVTWFGRGALVQQFPKLAEIYAMVGIGVDSVSLHFRDVRAVHAHQPGTDVLIVTGTLQSASDGVVPVPDIVVTLLDADGHDIYGWSIEPATRTLEPQGRVSVDARLPSPPPGARTVRLSLAGHGVAP